MSGSADIPASVSPEGLEARPSAVLPFNDPSQPRRLVKVAGWLAGIALTVVVLNLLGVDVVAWLSDLWDEIKSVPAGYMVGGLVFQTGQTVFAGLSYYGILRAAYPGQVDFWPINVERHARCVGARGGVSTEACASALVCGVRHAGLDVVLEAAGMVSEGFPGCFQQRSLGSTMRLFG
jgi:hypothetical protein